MAEFVEVAVKDVNGYTKTNGKKFIRIRTENGLVMFLNEGIIKYALEHAKEAKNND